MFISTVMAMKLIILSLLHFGLSGSDSIMEMQEKLKNLKPNNLTCHVCHSETNLDCFNLTDTWNFQQQCQQDKPFCVVRKFAFTVSNASETGDMNTFAVKRNCSDKCENGCVIMGERTRLYVCNQCCTTPNCNTGSGAGKTTMLFLNQLLFLPTFWFLSN